MRTCFKLLLASILLIGASCKKENKSDERACWQLIDFAAAPLNMVCDKTEAELIQCVADSTCGIYAFTAPLSNCFYYKVEGEKSCWLINDNIFLNDMIENEAKLLAHCFYNNGTLTKVDCADCELWYNREKRVYKPAGSITYSAITNRHYCGDTLSTIYQGREIIRKDDADSLISIQFSDDGAHW